MPRAKAGSPNSQLHLADPRRDSTPHFPAPVQSTDVGPDLDPREDDEDAQRDPLFQNLVRDLRRFNVPVGLIRSLYEQLNSFEAELHVEYAVASHNGTETLAEQFKNCRELAVAATSISKRFAYLKQLSPLDDFLFEAWANIYGTKGDPRVADRKLWGAFRERLHIDLADLARIAKAAMPAIKTQRARLGRPAKQERDGRFVALVTSLSDAESPMAKPVEVAWTAWQVWIHCFEAVGPTAGPTDKYGMRAAIGKAMRIEDLLAAEQIVGRHNRRRCQGQKG